MANTLLKIENLHAQYIDKNDPSEKTPILKGIDLELNIGETHAIMGPNGSGKSTLSATIMGHPSYQITEGKISLANQDGVLEDITSMPVYERARRGLFLSFQYPAAVPGLPVPQFLRSSLQSLRGADVPAREFRKELMEKMDTLKMSREFTKRYLNDGFSGGEKKRMEILQMELMRPRLAILDEIDSGLDIDALRLVSEGIGRLVSPERSFLVITHYKRLLEYVKPQQVHILAAGKIIKQGGAELVDRLESEGYDEILKEAALL